jgi:aspartyl-tRNA(Asn)/glutamyl-tRNA(Gln) amidotransferase subunit B
LLESGQAIVQETRLYDSTKNETRSMRSKEEANDYRYFPDPDLLPVEVSPELIEKLKAELPELPDQKRARFIEELGLSDYDSENLTSSRDMAVYFETALKISETDPKLCANWVMGELSAALNRENLDINESPVSAESFAGLLKRIKDNTISGKIAKQVFESMWDGEGDADSIIKAKGLQQVTDTGEIEIMVNKVIENNPDQVQQYRSSTSDKQAKLIGFFVGQIMKLSQGKANPQQVNKILKEKL